MAESLRPFENSLRDYLINVLADAHDTPHQLSYKYNNLKVYIDPKRESEPHFYVSVGISEVCFKIETLEKINGSLGSDERYISRWGAKPNINGELMKTWTIIAKATSASIGMSKENQELEEKLKISEAQNQKVDMLGTGINSRFKNFERSRQQWQRR